MTFPHRGYSGRILYSDDEGNEWGREDFSVTVHGNGRTIRALCEMDEARLHRDVNWSVGPDWIPREGFVRTLRDGVTIGSCWYRIEGSSVECEGVTESGGRVTKRLSSDGPIRFLGTHPLIGDCSIAAIRGTDDPGLEIPIMSAVNSTAPLGDEGLDVQLLAPLVAYIGPERTTILAGSFDAEHYTIRWSDRVPDVTDFWVHGPDCLPLLSIISGMRFEMTAIRYH